jgi:hypothetical protein
MNALADIGIGTLFAGCAGLMQLTLLPGLLLHLLLSRRDSQALPAIDTLLFMFAASATVSFLLALLLQVLGLHQRSSWMLLGWLQASACLYLMYHRQPRTQAVPERQLLTLASVMAALIYVFCFMQLLRTVLGHWPGVLEGWDAVISWNRWAQDWTRGDWPFLTWGYPQLIPAGWSVLYLWLGSSEVDLFARVWMGMFPLALVAIFLAHFQQTQRWTLLLAGAVTTALLLGPYRSVLDSGYVDVPVTFAVLLAGHWVMQAQQDIARANRWMLFAAVATAMALLTKQGGLLALGLYLWGCWNLRSQWRALLPAAAMLVTLAEPWYLLRWMQPPDASVLAYVTGDIYGNETVIARIWRALTETLPIATGVGGDSIVAVGIVLLAGTGFVMAWSERNGRFCAVVGAASLLIWAAFFSYDGRNLLPALPFLLLAAAYGFGGLPIPGIGNTSPIAVPAFTALQHLAFRISAALMVLVLLGALLPANVDRWEQLTNEIRKRTGDEQLNQQLIAMAAKPGLTGKVYTTYAPFAAISELRPWLFVDYGASHMQPQTAAMLRTAAPLCAILQTFPRYETIEYALLHRSIFPGVIQAALADGSLKPVLATDEQQLMRVRCAWSGSAP